MHLYKNFSYLHVQENNEQRYCLHSNESMSIRLKSANRPSVALIYAHGEIIKAHAI